MSTVEQTANSLTISLNEMGSRVGSGGNLILNGNPNSADNWTFNGLASYVDGYFSVPHYIPATEGAHGDTISQSLKGRLPTIAGQRKLRVSCDLRNTSENPSGYIHVWIRVKNTITGAMAWPDFRIYMTSLETEWKNFVGIISIVENYEVEAFGIGLYDSTSFDIKSIFLEDVTVARDAQLKAIDAAKTATNFMSYSSSGLVIGDMTSGTLGENVLIDSNSVDIRNGTTTLASFGATDIYLGKNSETSVINLCNGAATMRVKDNTDFRIYTDKRLVMSAYSSMLLDCWRDSTHMTRISIQSSDPNVSSVVGGVQFTIYQGNIQNTVSMLKNNIELKVTNGTSESRVNLDEGIFKVYAANRIRLNSKNPVQIAESSNYSAGLLLGSTFNMGKTISVYWSNGSAYDLVSHSSNGQTSYFGPADIGETTTTNIRGKYVRLYAHEGGGVYLGYSGSTAITSDRNMKKDIIDIDDKYIDFFDRLRPITYKYNVGHRDHIGFVAQEVEEALTASGLTTEQFAGLVIERDINLNPNYDSSLSDEENAANETNYDKLYSLRYEEFISLLVKKVQNLQKQIDELKGE